MEKYEEKYYVTIRCNDEQAAQELISKAESVGIKAYVEGDTKVFAEGDAVHKEAFIEAVKSEYDINMSDDKLKFSHLFLCDEQTALAIIQEAKKAGISVNGDEINGNKSLVGIIGGEKDKAQNEAFVDAIRAKYSDKIYNIEATATSDTFIMTGKKRERENPDIGNMTNAKNEAYENIEHKKFIYCNEQTAYELSEKAESMGVQFSAKFDGDKSSIVVDGVKDKAFVEIAKNDYDVSIPTFYNYAEYNKIENKEFLHCNARTVYDIGQKAQEQGIQYSAKFDGNKSSVIVDGIKNAAFVEAVKAEFDVRTDDEPTYFNKAEYKNIAHKEFINTDAKTAYEIGQKAQEQGIKFSAKFDDNKSTVTVNGVKDKAFVDAIRAKYSDKLNNIKATADRITSLMEEHKQERENPQIGTER